MRVENTIPRQRDAVKYKEHNNVPWSNCNDTKGFVDCHKGDANNLADARPRKEDNGVETKQNKTP